MSNEKHLTFKIFFRIVKSKEKYEQNIFLKRNVYSDLTHNKDIKKRFYTLTIIKDKKKLEYYVSIV